MDIETKTLADGSVWLSCDYLVTGDYGGAGSVGAANIKVLLDEHKGRIEQYSMSNWHYDPPQQLTGGVHSSWEDIKPEPDTTMVETYGAYSSTQVWLRDTPETRELLASLEDYPAIADDAISEVEIEWESEAWDRWLRSDLIRALRKFPAWDLELNETTIGDLADDIGSSDFFELYREAMEATNTYPEPEYSGVYVDVKRITAALAGLVLDYCKAKAIENADEDTTND
jgi:hypothetical protein